MSGNKTHAPVVGTRYFDYTPTQRIERKDGIDAQGKRVKDCYPQYRVGDTWHYGDGPGPVEYIYGRSEAEARSGDPLHLLEGEACCNALLGLGYRAITWRGGSGRVRKAMEQLVAICAGEHVRLWPDSDQPGRKAMRQIAAAIAPVAASVTWVDLYPDEKPEGGGKDVEDFLSDGTAEELAARVAAARAYEPEAPVSRAFATMGPSELKAAPALCYLMYGAIPERSLIEVVGRSGAMKSFIALDISLCRATARDWHGTATTPGRTLYIAAEGKAGMGQRIRAWEIAHGVTVPEAHFRMNKDALPQLLDHDDVQSIIDTANEWDADLILLDTLARTFGDGDENSTRDMRAYVDAASRIQGATGAAVGVVHHWGWNSERQRGNSALFAAVDAELTVTRDDDCITVKVTKAKDFAEGREWFLRPRTIAFTEGGSSLVLDDAEAEGFTTALTPATMRVGKLLWETFGAEGATHTAWIEVAKERQTPLSTFHKARRELVESGCITRPKRGERYRVTEAGRDALDLPADEVYVQCTNPPETSVGTQPQNVPISGASSAGGTSLVHSSVHDESTAIQRETGAGTFGTSLVHSDAMYQGASVSPFGTSPFRRDVPNGRTQPPTPDDADERFPFRSHFSPPEQVAPPFPTTPHHAVDTQQPLDTWLHEHEIEAVRAWAESAIAGQEEGRSIPNAVRKFCAQHRIDADPFDAMRPVGMAILRALEAIEAAKGVAP
jgi:hypothetical protein